MPSDLTIASDPYVAWLSDHHIPLFHRGTVSWRLYRNALVPASLRPAPVSLSPDDEKTLLHESGAALLRYFTRTFQQPTSFWYTCCHSYALDRLSANTRSQVRRGSKHCEVRRVSPDWIAANGFDCYAAAFSRYSGSRPDSREAFQARILSDAGGPFDYWVVFAEGNLAGYAKCVVGDDYVATVVFKFHPLYMRFYSSPALLHAMLQLYVSEQHKSVTNGFRSLAHDTNMQEFLERFAFRKIFCDLRVAYRPPVALGIRVLYPLRHILGRAPELGPASAVKSLLAQESIRRSFL
jgi:hypothetical protein